MPGAVLAADGAIELNAGRSLIELNVTNIRATGRSRWARTTTSSRRTARSSSTAPRRTGMRLNVPAGSSVRFEPGDSKTITLVEIAGNKRVGVGQQAGHGGPRTPARLDEVMERVNGRRLRRRAGGVAAAGGQAVPADAARTTRRCSARRWAIASSSATRGSIARWRRTTPSTATSASSAAARCCARAWGRRRAPAAGEALDLVITNALIVDAAARHPEGGHRHQGEPHRRDRQGGQPRRDGGRDAGDGHRRHDRGARRREDDRHRRRARHARALGSARSSSTRRSRRGVTTLYGGGTGPAHGSLATTCTPAPAQVKMMLQATDVFPMNFGFSSKGNTSDPVGHVRRARGRRRRLQAARGLGDDAGRDRRVPHVCRGARRRRHDPHRHAQRERVRRRLDRRDRRAHDPHVPLGGRRRRPRARHHQGVLGAERAAVVDEPDAAVHGEHRRRAPRHADGVPPPRQEHPRGRRVRRERASAARRSRRRTSSTTWARSRSWRPTRRRWAASAR